jgi:hypothetical protein
MSKVLQLIDDAYDSGYDAFYEFDVYGKFKQNPYHPISEHLLHKAWNDGWFDAGPGYCQE